MTISRSLTWGLWFVCAAALGCSFALADPTTDGAAAGNNPASLGKGGDVSVMPKGRRAGPRETSRLPRDPAVPLPGSGRVVPTPADVAARDSWTGCRSYLNRYKDPFKRCCSMVAGGQRTCNDVY